LHIVPDPAQMLKEAFRVMKKGAKCGISVLGREENSSYYTCFYNGLKRIGYECPAQRNFFHLGERELLMELVKKAGFEIDYCWYTTGAMNYFSFEEYMSISDSGGAGKHYSNLNEPQKQELRKVIEEEFMTKYKDKNIPLQYEMTMLIAKKP